MRPYRYRALPVRPAVHPPIHQPESKKPLRPDASSPKDLQSLDATAIFLLASCLQPQLQEDIQTLYPFLSPQSQSVASAALTAKANSAQIVESARIRAAIASQEGNANPQRRSVLQALKKTSMAKTYGGEINQAVDAMENIGKMQETLSQIQRDGASSFLSKHLESRLKEQSKGMASLMDVLMQKGQVTPAALMPMLMQNNQGNALMSMLMQSGGRLPLMSMLQQINTKASP